MNRAPRHNGAPAVDGLFAKRDILQESNPGLKRATGPGFTLLEMCIVLLIIAVLFGVTMPAMQSAFVEQGLRKDSHQLALMVKTAMIQSSEQHRPYVIDLGPTTIALHPMGEITKDADDVATDDISTASAASNATLDNVAVTDELDPPNKLLAPDPLKANAWVDIPPTSWIFQPGQLCPATRIRMARGDSWIELSFAALTGNVENESTYFP